MKKSLNHFGYIKISYSYLIRHYEHLYKIENEFKNNYHCFELISNRCYWFKIRIHFDDLKNLKDDFYFSIYGENICCLELFKMHTYLTPLTIQEFITHVETKQSSSPYKLFTK